jgi:ribosomal-protein-alanine N-acetyltransferase
MELFTPRLRLREFTEHDYPALRDMDTRAEFNTYEREFVSEADTHNSLAESISTQLEIPRSVYRLAISIPPQDLVKGVIKISSHYAKIREWEVGWAVHPDEWRKGYATEAAWRLIDWAFRELSIHRMVAFCHADNVASVRVMEKLGMHQDGRLRETRWLNGVWWDEFVYAILENEWKRNADHACASLTMRV